VNRTTAEPRRAQRELDRLVERREGNPPHLISVALTTISSVWGAKTLFAPHDHLDFQAKLNFRTHTHAPLETTSQFGSVLNLAWH
jgi:hypothetical protein